jgi:phage-related protein
MKPLKFVGSALDELRRFPIDARRSVGHELWQVQMGLLPTDFRPMPSVGGGCYEIRVHTGEEWRVIYVAKFADAIYVLHAFQKKSRATARHDLEIARKRYDQIRTRL